MIHLSAKWHIWQAVSVCLCAWLLPRQVAARDLICDVPTNYMVMLNGTNTVKIQVPIYDEESYDTWVEDGYLRYEVQDKEGNFSGETTLFRWYTDDTSHDNDYNGIWAKYQTWAGGSIEVTPGQTSSHFTLTSDKSEMREYTYERTSDHTYTVYAVWTVPYNVRGKTLRFKWQVKRNGTSSRKRFDVDIDNVTITIPEPEGQVQPQVTAASLSLTNKGQLELPWFISSTKVQKVVAKYKNATGNGWITQSLMAGSNGTLLLPATEPHDGFRIIVDYLDNNNYLIEGVESSAQDLGMIHAPVNFQTTSVGDSKASVQLTWDIEYPDHKDLAPFDMFEIQRSITGEEADFVTIGVETFDLATLHYTYIDSTLVDAIAEGHLKVNGTLDNLTYRVRRMMTQNWGWEGNNCAASSVCPMHNLHLVSISDYDAKWEDEQAFTVRVTWEYADEYGAVWDDRAQIKLCITSTNGAGEVVETKEYILTNEEREARYKILNLSRPCVDYKIEVFVDKGNSPLMVNSEQFVSITSVEDWNTFAESVGQGKSQNAILMADITVSKMVGTGAHPFTGIFNGNGHTLNFTINGSNSYIAPFAMVGDAVIRNLHVTGKITNSGKFNAGLVARIADNATVFIESCRSSLEINNTLSGDASDGGLVANANYVKLLTFRNCLFDGQFSGKSCHSCGGFVGWSRGKVIIENSLFSPVSIQTSYDTCDTWARMSDRNNLTISNSYCTKDYTKGHEGFIVINNAADWKAFRDKVASGNMNREVNVVLGADISTDLWIGDSEGTAYHGTFDGNGHTLEFNATSTDAYFAPFRYVYLSTFRNLHVTGNINGGIHSAGLIGMCSSSVTIERVWVSADITATGDDTNKPHLGGFVGHAKNATCTIEDCVFDGVLTASEKDGSYGGAIVGWGGFATYAPNLTMHRVYENATYNNIHHAGFSYWYDEYAHSPKTWGSNTSSTNCISAHNWGEMASANHRNVIDQSALVSTMNSEKANSWQVVGGSAVPVMRSLTTVTSFSAQELLDTLGRSWQKEVNDKVVPRFAHVNPNPELPTFHHVSTGKVDTTLKTETRQSSVLLTWKTDGNPIDYFIVLRRIKGKTDWTTIAPSVDQMSYEDTTVSPLEYYEYMVRGANDCEGMSYSDTEVKEGSCKHSGKLDGYVRFKDGTGVPGITLEIVSGEVKTTATTDEKGYFMAEDLSYQKQQSIEYVVTPVSASDIKLEVESYSVTFNNESNYQQVHEFTITNSHRFSGYVMYDGTSIPVKGARFRVNGSEIHNAAGEYVETDFEGRFSFNVLGGRNVIQAVMDGHTFTNDGYFKSSDGYVFDDNVAQIYFYDATKVKLTGRIVGGNDQGRLPLDNNLSHNNLGDELTMVMILEGDNTSWLVYDNLNPEQSIRNDIFMHPGAGGHQTKVEVQRKRMVVKPDATTGEYVLMLPPVRWKVQQVYCEGYPTLFQDGMVSEVIDLTECLTACDTTYEGTFTDVDGKSIYQPKENYNYRYNRIYHAPVEITYRQVGYDAFDYFGDRAYQAQTAGGKAATVPLVYQNADTVAYTFGHPVFSLGRKYPILLSVAERYPYNNNVNSGKIDQVKIGGGRVTVHNGMKNGLHQEVVELDSLGQGMFYIEAEQTTRLLTGEDALRTVSMTVEQDGITYEAKPLQGYILNMFPTSGAKDVLVSNQPLLVDILRDPPGANSTATLEKGSTLKLNYTLEMSYKAGLTLSYTSGTTLDNFQGVVAAPAGAGSTYGIINKSDTETTDGIGYGINGEGKRDFTYTMNVEQDISTSDDKNMVGAEADLYIGITQNMVVTPMSTIRAIPDSIFQQMLGRLGGGAMAGVADKYGTLVEIAQGRDAGGNLYHLIRDESLAYGPKITSQFIHSQKYILTQMVPGLIQQCRALMFTGTETEAQKLANDTGRPIYRSLVDADDENFGLLNAKNGKPYYYTSTMPAEEGMNYVIHLPSNVTVDPKDEVAEKCQIIMSWLNMIAENEREKLNASDLVANYDIDGGTEVNYSEEFESDYSISNYMHLPGVISGSYFDNCWSDKLLGIGGMVGIKIANVFIKKLWGKLDQSARAEGSEHDDVNDFTTKVSFAGKNFEFSILPVLEYEVKDTSGEEKSYNRKESFKLSMHKKSHLNIDVFRTQTDAKVEKTTKIFDVFTNYNFNNLTEYVEPFLARDLDLTKARYARGFVYRTRGGATCISWEDERRTMFYNEGTILDERTKKITNPKITLDRQSISGVPYGEPARFKVFLTNESEVPEAATGGLVVYGLYLEETANPKGAKLLVDGMPLSGGGREVYLYPGEVTQKILEVYAGEDFDYEGLTIGINAPEDWTHIDDQVSFDVHFLRQAGPVNISSPGDKWIMNTDAQYNEKRGWFLPVTIDGFDKHQKNFDHIEFQYKESLRGDDFWTNLCSYYADSTLMANANGVCEMIPENGNITTQFYGEGTVMEKGYDLRAVLYCRDGNSFLTTASKIISGVKDTRRPQLFGTPEPTDGIVGNGDNIIFNFSEGIEFNYLNATTNFEVKGEVNNNNVSESVSLQFTGQASVETEAQRNFSGKDVTIDMMIKPAATGREMPLFSHGTNGKKLQLWLTEDYHLKAVVNSQTFTSTDTILHTAFSQVALVMGQDSILTFYNGGKELGQFKLTEPYNGTGSLFFGRTNESDRNKSQYYEGRMMEVRLWYRTLTGGLLGTTYGSRRLTGFEMGLVDYYPMNEGSGDYALDHAQGANALLKGASWAIPRGLSLHIDWEDRGVALTQNALNRTSEQDYTLMFWFKTDKEGRGVLLSNGAGKRNEVGAENLFNIAFEAEKLMYRTHGMAIEVPGDYSDGGWHHFTMTVNRAFNVANIYVDQTLRSTFAADSLGGISGGHPLIGAALYDEIQADGTVSTIDTRNWLRGNIDELCLFAQALPLELIQSYSTKSPNGDEAGLLTFLSFDHQERQKDNDIVLVAYPYSKKIYLDDNGDVKYQLDPVTNEPTKTPVRDYVFVDSLDNILSHIDDTQAAPVVPYEELKNLNFSYVGKDNQVLLNINEPASRINRRNVYVTLRDIEDRNGNAMASPATACFYITNSNLKWLTNRITESAYYGDESTLFLTISNESATSHIYTIENCPKWLTLNSYNNVISAQDIVNITAKVNKSLNVGTYDEIIYLTDEDGVSEPLYLNLTIEASEPDWVWNIPGDLLQHTMNIAGQVYINDEIDIDSRDIVGVFDRQNQCHGFAHINYSEQTGESSIFMTIYDNQVSGRELSFKLWQYSTGHELTLSFSVNGEARKKTLKFEKSSVLGVDTPVRFYGGDQYVQTFNLKEGWNWVSFNVSSNDLYDLHKLLDGLPWMDGDVLTDMSSNLTLVYRGGKWLATDNPDIKILSSRKAYAIKVQQNIEFPVAGYVIKAADQRTISLRQGWNGIGYTPMINLSVETALSDYYDKAEPGDVVKSHDEFAYFTVTGGVGRWRGNLQYMKPGEGYMLLRKSSTPASFRYPLYEPGNTFFDDWSYTPSQTKQRSKHTMSLSAVVSGFTPEHGDRLVAYSDGEVCGSVDASCEDVLYMSIGADREKPLWFAIERDGEIVASTSEVMRFKINGVVGSPDEPTSIHFTRNEYEDGNWYTISGVQLPNRPTSKGIYIFNGKKILIK